MAAWALVINIQGLDVDKQRLLLDMFVKTYLHQSSTATSAFAAIADDTHASAIFHLAQLRSAPMPSGASLHTNDRQKLQCFGKRHGDFLEPMEITTVVENYNEHVQRHGMRCIYDEARGAELANMLEAGA
jgi:hypothetical protein